MARNDEKDDDDVPVLVRPAPHGRVVNAGGNPVPGVRVRLVHARSRWSPDNGVVQETLAGADGRFSLPAEVRFHDPAALHNPAEYTLVADAGGLAPGWVSLLPNDSPNAEPTLTLTEPQRQKVEVLDRKGKPVAGAVLWLHGAGEPDDPRPIFQSVLSLPADIGLCRAVTDSAGLALLENLPDARFCIITSKEGFGDSWLFLSKPVAEPQQVVLQVASVLEGRVSDPSGRPVAGAQVWLFPKFRFWHFFSGKTDEQGCYRIDKIWSDIEANTDKQDWGKYTVSLVDPRFTAYTRDVAFTNGETVTGFDLFAIQATEIVGVLLDPETKAPVVGATVTVTSAAGRRTLCTNAAGRFHARIPPGEITAFFDQPPGGCYVLDDRGGSRRLSRLRASATGERLAFELYLPSRLGRLGVVSGQVRTLDGKPAARCVVSPVIASDGRLKLGNWTGNVMRGVTADAEGRFTLTGMPIGLAFTLFARAPGDAATGTMAGKLEKETFELPGPLVLRPTVPGGEFLITDVFGKPRPNFALIVRAIVAGKDLFSQDHDLESNGEGVLCVPLLSPGTRYSVWVIDERRVNLLLNFFESPEAGSPPSPRRTLLVDERCRVRLLGPDGKPLPIKRFRNFEVRTTFESMPSRWTNSLPVVGRIGPDALVSWRNLGCRGKTAQFHIETDEGALIHAEGKIPDEGSGLIVAHALNGNGHEATWR